MMSWVEELTEDDDVEVEIIYPQSYVDYNMATMRRYAAGISSICKGYAILGETEAEFMVFGMTIVQVVSLEEILKQFGIELAHDHGHLPDGKRWTYFYADLRGLIEKMESGEFDGAN